MQNEIQDLRDQAERCRKLATVVEAEGNRRQLLEMAEALEEQAVKLEGGGRTNA